MLEVVSCLRKINKELEDVLEAIDADELDAFLQAVAGAGKIALYGVGREGLVIRAFAMRLFHPGYSVSVVGDDRGTKGRSILPMGSLYGLAMFALFEIIVLELLARTGNTFGEARDRHTNLE